MRPLFDETRNDLYDVRTTATGPVGMLPLTPELLRNSPSGDLFGLSQNAGMGWKAAEVLRKPFLILSTQGGLRDADGTPIALGYHTGHFELDELVRTSAYELHELEVLPFAGFVSDPCDGRTQGTTGMFDSLPYRNDAAQVLRRLIRSLPTRRGVIGIATCDKGLPAMTMGVASMSDLPGVIVPGGVTLPPATGEDAGKIQTLGVRYAHDMITLREAAELGCRACATPGGGCQFLGTAATMQVVAEALGMTVPHAALAPSGQPVWRDVATRSARAVYDLETRGRTVRDILTPGAIRNAMTIHAAFGGSTNLLLHLPAIAHAAGLPRPTVEDWSEVNQRTPRLVSVLPNGPVDHPTIRVFLAGGVPEVMLHLREAGLVDTSLMTASGRTWDEVLDGWFESERRSRFRNALMEHDGVDPDDVIFTPGRAVAAGLARTLVFPRGNLAPDGSVVKCTGIDPALFDPTGRYLHTGPARVFTTEHSAMRAIKAGEIREGDVMILAGAGPLATGMEETYQLTSALKHLPHGGRVPLITDARFSGVSTGPCVGHVGPEALAGGPIAKLRDGDRVRIEIDKNTGYGAIDFVGTSDAALDRDTGARALEARPAHPGLEPRPDLPADTRLWAALQAASGGTWGGCVYDVDQILERLEMPGRGTP